ncbi:uncharacterized protein At5g41620-like isoform X2 [Zingiber officinale]|uniref:uncharacterized protein At5g41620-like isoform X2 n=1 Tax=Zingiber officinale TaxID=94328 RepID=UPI001C4C7A6E|nr:uncharacterized protein At5g41620-like isoform X2 [Zingiber officinale]
MEGGMAVAGDDEGSSGVGKEEFLGVKLRRGVAVEKKGGLCTPVPAWKLGALGSSESEPSEPKRSSVSARKLGANLWENQDLVPYAATSRRRDKLRRQREGKAIDDGLDNRLENASSLRRHVAASLVKNYKLNERKTRAVELASPASYSSSMKLAAISQATPCSLLDLKGKNGAAGYGLRTSTELLKLLNRVWSLEEQHESNVSLVKALKVELEHAQAHIQELMQEHHLYRCEMDDLMKQLGDDKLIRKNKEQQKVKEAVQSVRDELEDERHLRRCSESLHRKLGKELSEVNAVYMNVLKDLDTERKSCGLLEDLCDEFAKGITDYEQEVRELSQTTPRDCCHKVDRLVLHISEAWLDERVQMNIAEAQGDLAEKTTVADRLRNEIESFLHTRKASALHGNNAYDDKRHCNLRRQSLESVHLNGATSAPHDADDEDESVASDTLCFELNVSSRNHGSHDQLKHINQNVLEKLETRGMTTSLGEKIGPSDCNENLSDLHIQYNQLIDKAKLSVNRIQLLNRLQEVHFPTDDEQAKIEVDPTETSRSLKSDCYHSQEHRHDTEQNLSHMNGSKHQTDNPVKNLAAVSGCGSVDQGTCREDSHMLWKSQIASIEDSDFGNVHQTNSPVPQWKHQQTPYLAESSSRLARGVKESTLKTKLLEARSEGKHSRLKTIKRAPTVRIKHWG